MVCGKVARLRTVRARRSPSLDQLVRRVGECDPGDSVPEVQVLADFVQSHDSLDVLGPTMVVQAGSDSPAFPAPLGHTII